MAKYYGIERSDEYLAHYGIRGMKWGVRKALERGDRAAVSRHYKKAVMKLAKLSLNANRGAQQNRYNNAKRRMISGIVGSAVGSAGLSAALNSTKNMGIKNIAANAGISAAAGALGGAILNSRGITARRHISDRGHARAIVKRDAWRKEIESTFENVPGVKKNELTKFHKQITAMSDQSDPRAYIYKQFKKAQTNAYKSGGHDVFLKTGKNGMLNSHQSHIKDSAMRRQAENYVKHYNAAIKQGLDKNGASNYANEQLIKQAKSKKRRR